MESTNIRELTDELLVQELRSTEAEYHKALFEHSAQGIANPLSLRAMRREIAAYKTEIRSREVAKMTPEQINKRSKIRARRRK